MNGIHDFGGMQGFGPIAPTPSEHPFREDWERRAMAMFAAVAGGGFFNVDEFRYAIERMSPIDYLSTTYYEHWLHALELLMIEKGILTQDELHYAFEAQRSA